MPKFSFQARHFFEGVPGVSSWESNEARDEKAVKDALKRVFRHALSRSWQGNSQVQGTERKERI
jgi:hypothetical protein